MQTRKIDDSETTSGGNQWNNICQQFPFHHGTVPGFNPYACDYHMIVIAIITLQRELSAKIGSKIAPHQLFCLAWSYYVVLSISVNDIHKYSKVFTLRTLRQSNMAMDNGPFIGDFPLPCLIIRGYQYSNWHRQPSRLVDLETPQERYINRTPWRCGRFFVISRIILSNMAMVSNYPLVFVT